MRLARYLLGALFLTGAGGLAASCGDDNVSTMPTGGSTTTSSSTGGRAGTGGSSVTSTGGGGGSGGAAGRGGGGAGGGGTAGSGGGGTAGSGGGGTAGSGGGGTAGSGGGGTAGSGGGGTDAGADTGTDAGPGDASPDVSVGNDGAPEAQAPDAQDASQSDEQGDATSDAIISTEGAPGDGAAAAAKGCFRTCNSKSDCPNIQLQQYLCNTTQHHCAVCLTDITCVAQSSGWTVDTCTTDADCTGAATGDYCVDVDGVGRCAFDKTKPSGPGDECDGLPDVITAKKFGSATTVEVCGDATPRCDTTRGACVTDCAGNSCTPALGGKVCNAAKKCECGSNTDCGGSTPTCNTAIKQCECGSANDCPATDGAVTYVCE